MTEKYLCCMINVKFIFRKAFGKKSSNISEPLAIVWTQVDPIKDIALVARMIAMLGGHLIVLINPELFSSVVS